MKFKFRDFLAFPFVVLGGTLFYIGVLVGGEWTVWSIIEDFLPSRINIKTGDIVSYYKKHVE